MKRILAQLIVKKEKQRKGKLSNKKWQALEASPGIFQASKAEEGKQGDTQLPTEPWNSHVRCIRGVDHIPCASPGLRALGTESGWVGMGVGEGEWAGSAILLL